MTKLLHKSFFVVLLLFLWQTIAWAQNPNDVVKWKFEHKKIKDNTYDIIGTANITMPNFHVWALGTTGDGTLIPTTLVIPKSKNYKLIGSVKANGKLSTTDDELMGPLKYYSGIVKYTQRVEVTENTTIKGHAYFQTCNEEGQCLRPTEVPFEIKITDAISLKDTATKDSTIATTPTDTVRADSTIVQGDSTQSDSSNVAAISATSNTNQPPTIAASNEIESKSLWQIFIAGLVAGFVAFIMPCIYAMLPVTVSFFTKRSKDRATGIKNAIFYSLSIILIFAAIGGLISIFFTEKTMYEISTSIWFNMFVFIIFVVFGISLLGAFEITLPASWTNAIDKRSNTNSFGGIFFMALVLVIVSFSCTSAFISTLIVYIIQSGNKLGGIIGFLGFGMAIALPFAMGALFPGMINKMAKSGGWLNAVKVTMGFLELALALKFLSNVDLAYHWGILDIETFIAIWIVIFGLLGIYLLGKLKLPHDEELPKNTHGQPHVGVTRLLFAIASLAFTVYMIPGLWGAPLTAISGFLPETKTHDFNLKRQLTEIQTAGVESDVKPVKYTDFLDTELPGIDAFFNYEEALAAGKKTGKPVLLDFTGHSCINCRKMERLVLSQPEILTILKKDFIVASLYVDDKTVVPEEDHRISKHDGKTVLKTLGDINFDIELTQFNSVAQPLYVFVDGDGKLIENAGGYDKDVQRFVRILQSVKEKHAAAQK